MKYFKEKTFNVLKELEVDSDKGLSNSEAKSRLEKYGPNEFTKQEKGSIWDDIKDALTEPMKIGRASCRERVS